MHEHALKKTINMAGSINKLANKLGLPRVTVSAWLNRNIKIPLEHAFQMEWFTKGEVAWQELVTPNIVRILKRCSFTMHTNFVFESVYISLTRIKYAHTNYSCNTLNLLLEDIKKNDLQNPICIDTDNNLIFGRKRLFAYELLGKKTIPAWRISLSDLINGKYNSEALSQTFSISERIAIGIALENKIGKHQGKRTDKKQLVQNSAQVKSIKKKRDYVAEQLGFGSHFTYQEAKKIKIHGTSELIDAVDKQSLSISTAAKLIKLTPKEQIKILSLNYKEIIFIANQIRKQKISLSSKKLTFTQRNS